MLQIDSFELFVILISMMFKYIYVARKKWELNYVMQTSLESF